MMFLMGLFFERRTIRKSRIENAKKLYSCAYSTFVDGNYAHALAILGEAAGNRKHPQIYNLMGHIYEKLNMHELEARSFFEAHREIFKNFSFTRPNSYPQDITYFYYRESLAHSRTNNWEFTYMRADTALKMIRRKEIPAMVDGVNFEQELVALRMMSALSHLKGTVALEVLRADGQWLVARTTNQLLKDLAQAILDISEEDREISPDAF
ncbi:MAG: hypothetical protein ACREBV_02675 [Candidatus Zixiibacteriota bacterium]